MEPKPGQYLYASCSAKDYGRILRVSKDAAGAAAIDIEIFDINDTLYFPEDEQFSKPIWTEIELSPGAIAVLRDVLYTVTKDHIICNTPGNGCFRCTKLFTLHDKPREEMTEGDWEKLG